MSRISSMARFRVAAALEEERQREDEEEEEEEENDDVQKASPSCSNHNNNNNNAKANGSSDSPVKGQQKMPQILVDGRQNRLPSVARFLANRRRSKSQSRLLDSKFFLRIVAAFDHQSGTRCCHSHLDDGLCGRFMRRQLLLGDGHHHHHHRAGAGSYSPSNGACGGSRHSRRLGRLNGATSGWDLLTAAQQEDEAELYSLQMDMPIKVLNGSPGYMNILDGLNAWQLVSELSDATGQPAAASFKHVSPAGAAIGVPLNEAEMQSLMVADLALDQRRHSLAAAVARAREQDWYAETPNTAKIRQILGADRMSLFGDFIALSHKCDELTARLISREVSDGVIAPDYEEFALTMLAKKKTGNYVVLKIDPRYLPAEDEVRTIFGLKLKQKRNTAALSTESFSDVAVGDGDEITAQTVDDLLVACVAVKYCQSNAVCLAHRGQVIGMGAGQQSRLNCTRLGAEKAANWWLRQHPRILSLPWRANVRRQEKANIVDAIVAGAVRTDEEGTTADDGNANEGNHRLSPRSGEQLLSTSERQWNCYFAEPVKAFSQRERREWLARMTGVCLASESPFPNRDSIDLAKQFGAKFVVTPNGGAHDDDICEACEQNGMVLVHTMGQR